MPDLGIMKAQANHSLRSDATNLDLNRVARTRDAGRSRFLDIWRKIVDFIAVTIGFRTPEEITDKGPFLDQLWRQGDDYSSIETFRALVHQTECGSPIAFDNLTPQQVERLRENLLHNPELESAIKDAVEELRTWPNSDEKTEFLEFLKGLSGNLDEILDTACEQCGATGAVSYESARNQNVQDRILQALLSAAAFKFGKFGDTPAKLIQDQLDEPLTITHGYVKSLFDECVIRAQRKSSQFHTGADVFANDFMKAPLFARGSVLGSLMRAKAAEGEENVGKQLDEAITTLINAEKGRVVGSRAPLTPRGGTAAPRQPMQERLEVRPIPPSVAAADPKQVYDAVQAGEIMNRFNLQGTIEAEDFKGLLRQAMVKTGEAHSETDLESDCKKFMAHSSKLRHSVLFFLVEAIKDKSSLAKLWLTNARDYLKHAPLLLTLNDLPEIRSREEAGWAVHDIARQYESETELKNAVRATLTQKTAAAFLVHLKDVQFAGRSKLVHDLIVEMVKPAPAEDVSEIVDNFNLAGTIEQSDFERLLNGVLQSAAAPPEELKSEKFPSTFMGLSAGDQLSILWFLRQATKSPSYVEHVLDAVSTRLKHRSDPATFDTLQSIRLGDKAIGAIHDIARQIQAHSEEEFRTIVTSRARKLEREVVLRFVEILGQAKFTGRSKIVAEALRARADRL